MCKESRTSMVWTLDIYEYNNIAAVGILWWYI